MKTSKNFSRRKFMGGMAISAAAFQVVPGSVLGLNGAVSANERLNIAGQEENIVALCDVDWAHAAGTFESAMPKLTVSWLVVFGLQKKRSIRMSALRAEPPGLINRSQTEGTLT